jgi:hypothetical protein
MLGIPRPTPPDHSTADIVVAATRWLVTRYRQHRDPRLARLVEQHLGWLAAHPDLAATRARLASDWRHAVSANVH